MSTNIKIVEHVVQELPSERPLVKGEKYKVMQSDGTLIEYVINSQGEPMFVRGITDEQNGRLNRLSSEQISKVESITTGDISKLKDLDNQDETDSKLNSKVDKESGKSLVSDPEIEKLENLKTQSEIDSDIATATSNASANLIPVTGTVLPRGAQIPSYITSAGKAELLGGDDEDGKTFTNTGTTPSTFNVPKGSVGYAYYDKATDSWSLVDMGELPEVEVVADLDSTDDNKALAASQGKVLNLKDAIWLLNRNTTYTASEFSTIQRILDLKIYVKYTTGVYTINELRLLGNGDVRIHIFRNGATFRERNFSPAGNEYSSPGDIEVSYDLNLGTTGLNTLDSSIILSSSALIPLSSYLKDLSYEITSVVNSDSYGNVTLADILWADGSSGAYQATSFNSSFASYDGYKVTHHRSNSTLEQLPVTRNSLGVVTNKPALTIY